MQVIINIKNVYTWYRESTKEWVITVQALTNSCSLSLNYSAKTLNKAKKQMWKHLPQDLIAEEISLNFNTILSGSESEDTFNLCNKCNNERCVMQSGICRNNCDFFIAKESEDEV